MDSGKVIPQHRNIVAISVFVTHNCRICHLVS